MRITCPWCGPRLSGEFTYGGDASKKRPENPDKAKLDKWVDYIYVRDNPAGAHREYWHHTGGCRSWLVVTRDTVTHEIGKVVLAQPSGGRVGK